MTHAASCPGAADCQCASVDLQRARQRVRDERRALRDVVVHRRKMEQEYERALDAERTYFARFMEAMKERAAARQAVAEHAVAEALAEDEPEVQEGKSRG